MGALSLSNASVEARARRMALPTGLFTAILHSWAQDGDVAQSLRRGSIRLETTSASMLCRTCNASRASPLGPLGPS